MKNLIVRFVFFSALIFLSNSCDTSYVEQEIEEIDDWDGMVQFPLGYVNYTIAEIFQDLGSDDFDLESMEEISLSYTESFSGVDDSAFDVELPPTTITATIATPVTPADISPETFPVTLSVIPEELNGKTTNDQVVHDLALDQEMTGASFDGGILKLTFTSDFDAEVSVLLEIPSLTKKTDASTFFQNITIDRRATETVSINLNQYNANFTHDGTAFNMTNNTLVINLEANFNFFVGSELDATDAISYEVVLSDASTDVVFGDFKQESFSVSENSISLSGFDGFDSDDISFSNTKMELTATSDYGFPIAMDLSGIKSLKNGVPTNLTYSGDQSISNTLIIEGVNTYGDDPKVTTRTLNNSNSNINALFENNPTEVQLNINGYVNPYNLNPNKNFYARPNEGLNLDLTIRFDNVSFTQELEFENGDTVENLTSFNLMVSVENKIPLSGDIELGFVNPSGQTVHTESLNVFSAANITATGASDGKAVRSDFSIELDEDEITQIATATVLSVTVKLQLPTNQNSILLKGSDGLGIYISAGISGGISAVNN